MLLEAMPRGPCMAGWGDKSSKARFRHICDSIQSESLRHLATL